MRKSIAVITTVSVMISCLLTGCSIVTGATNDNKPPHPTGKSSPGIAIHIDTSTFEFSHRIMCRQIHTSRHSMIFSGTSDLADGTLLQSQLYENDTRINWWPADREYMVENGEWEIKVLMKEIGAHEDLTPSSNYWLIIWVKDNPLIIDGVYWDTIGPPAP